MPTSAAGLFAGLADWTVNNGDAAGDTYDSIENLLGSAFNDVSGLSSAVTTTVSVPSPAASITES